MFLFFFLISVCKISIESYAHDEMINSVGMFLFFFLLGKKKKRENNGKSVCVILRSKCLLKNSNYRIINVFQDYGLSPFYLAIFIQLIVAFRLFYLSIEIEKQHKKNCTDDSRYNDVLIIITSKRAIFQYVFFLPCIV